MSVMHRDRRLGKERRSGADRRKVDRPRFENPQGRRGIESPASVEKAMELKASFAEIWYWKGETCFLRKKFNEARDAFNQAVQIDPTFTRAFYGLARIFLKSGEKNRGLYHLRKAIEIDPDVKKEARKDQNFKAMWNDKDFEKITK